MTQEPVSKATYLKVFAWLMGLLVLNLVLDRFHLGMFGTPLTVSIAVVMAILQIIYFMNVRYNPRLVWIYASMGFLWFCFLVVGTLMDVLTR